MDFEIEMQVENIEGETQKNIQEKETAENNLEEIEVTLCSLEKDKLVQKELMKVRNRQQEKIERIERNTRDIRNKVNRMQEILMKEEETIANAEENIEILEALGEEVSEAKEVLHQREQVLKEFRKRITSVLEQIGGQLTDAKRQVNERNLSKDLENPHLFHKYERGKYVYGRDETGQYATGYLKMGECHDRDFKAQLEAGGDKRRRRNSKYGIDNGGHLIGARFDGDAISENLTAQDSNLNHSAYRKMENEWARYLEADYKVFVHIEAYGVSRPSAYMGYAIFESPDGKREFKVYSFNNESRKEQTKWEKEFEEYEMQ